jgi:hypothetical protein
MPESYKYPLAIKRQLEPAHRELVQRGFLSRADFEERGRGAPKSNVVRAKPRFHQRLQVAELPSRFLAREHAFGDLLEGRDQRVERGRGESA